METSEIRDVSDTALWVATFRARESLRPDALFNDPYAGLLAGERGQAIADRMPGSRYTDWSVVIRTCIIDQYILEQVQNGVDTILNLGSGLDTRPYRLALPESTKWIEVDFPKMIDFKKEKLKGEKTICEHLMIGQDLSDQKLRQQLFQKVSQSAKKVLVLAEGVVPYLTNQQTRELAEDLSSVKNFEYWIVDFFSKEVLKYMNSASRRKHLKNAPFVFKPDHWEDFFKAEGWMVQEKRFIAEQSLKLGRPIPTPWWFVMVRPLLSRERLRQAGLNSGYFLLRNFRR